MSFFNPFRKSKRQEGVRLAGMTADADPRDAGASPEDGAPDGRREPSLGAPQSAPAAFAAHLMLGTSGFTPASFITHLTLGASASHVAIARTAPTTRFASPARTV